MSDLFFYGSLRHVPLLEVVLGRACDALDLVTARLPEHCVFGVRGEPFPMVQATQGQMAPGVLVRGLSDEDIARVRYYEGGFDYDLLPVSVNLDDGAAADAQVFFPEPGLWQSDQPWSLSDWQAKWGAISTRAATEVMAHYGHLSAAEIAARFPGIRNRAAAWVAAQARPADPDRNLARDVVVQAHHRPYVNFFAAQEMDLQFRRHDGTLSPVLNRGAQVLGQATVVLPYDPQRDAVLLIEQFRAPVYIGGDPAPWVWEPISGLIDPGETPQQAAHREAMEEAGLHLSHLDPVAGSYSSTGASSEFVHMFIGLTDLGDITPTGGLADEGEDIRSRVISFDALMHGIDNQQFRDMPLVTAALWLARHRDRLRKTA